MYSILLLLSVSSVATAAASIDHAEHKNLFATDSNVLEIETPLELRKLIDETTYVSHLTLLYSAWCPHCHAFAPIWSRLGAKLHCAKNAGRVDVTAFECLSSHASRSTPGDKWEAYTGSRFPGSSTGDVVSPNQMCAALADGSYPSILISLANNQTVDSPFTHFKPTSGVTSEKIALFHLPVDSTITSLPTLVRILHEAGIAESCESGGSGESGEQLALAWLAAQPEKPSRKPSSDEDGRWSQLALEHRPDTRLYDSVVGFYHILQDWVFAERPQIIVDEVLVLKNLLLAFGTAAPDAASKKQLFDLLAFVDQRSDSLHVDEWRERVRKLKLMGIEPSPENNFELASKTCRTSSCLVWTALHAFAQLRLNAIEELTKDERRHLLFVPLFSPQRRPSIPPTSDSAELARTHIRAADFAEVLDQLVTTFFNCQSCQKHFHEAFEQCGADRCAWLQDGGKPMFSMSVLSEADRREDLGESYGLTLWLWRFHNIVTLRTATEKSMNDLLISLDKDQNLSSPRSLLFSDQDVRFPNSATCDLCHIAGKEPLKISPKWIQKYLASGMEETIMDFDHFDDWDVPVIAVFLRHFYTKPDWLPCLNSLQWNSTDSTFTVAKPERQLRTHFSIFRPSRKHAPNFLMK